MAELTAAPVLSTPADNLFPAAAALPDDSETPRRTDDELRAVYEIARTAREVHAGGHKRVALQFPDTMLGDAPRVVHLLQAALAAERAAAAVAAAADKVASVDPATEEKIYILADTSYSACCVDEIAAEHAAADVVVHYGRACLSPTSRLPVVYVFTTHPLDHGRVVDRFARQFPADAAATTRAVLMADVTYQDHVPAVFAQLRARGYARVLATAVVHNPLGSIPNRRLVDEQGATVPDEDVDLREYAVFHMAAPPSSLLLALAARVRTFLVYTPGSSEDDGNNDGDNNDGVLVPHTLGMLGRRYAKVLTMATAGVIGVLVNTLSVTNYLTAVAAIRARIAAAGKKSYVVVVGKLNPAKLANFAEIDGWVVVGCWESSLVEDDAGFYAPVVTPFELELALQRDDERVWGDKWWGGLEALTDAAGGTGQTDGGTNGGVNGADNNNNDDDNVDDDEDSEVPQFDLRTGRLITTSRPMRSRGRQPKEGTTTTTGNGTAPSGALSLRPKAELATVNGVVSPGAEFLRSQRTWQGLGSDFTAEDAVAHASTLVREGRSGVARGYTVGEDEQRT
ncbi:diphthamide biosynthesis protein [Niveomyces insectorum RCEF 264]|uniref:2-(3-amino-3-carboxypropyl)histidine synthase subunit 2 n=1 Tax=Niveomyces insectorum RCEF 264 TaxID=1081102 RepID=A0A167LU47_9HYPO|nr:diphthamide biosynthesis protein [Niveomyces insectorum RCEF 264]